MTTPAMVKRPTEQSKRCSSALSQKSKVAQTNPLLANLHATPLALLSSKPNSLLQLQRDYGNRAVRRLIQAKLTVGPANDRYEQEADRVAEQVVRAPASTAPQVQRAGDEDEVQAKPLAATITPLVQREAAPEEEEVQAKRVQRETTPEDEEPVQAKLIQRDPAPEEEELQAKFIQRRAEGGFDAGPQLEERLSARSGSGQPLGRETQSFMESRFGADFSGVRVHTDGEAASLSHSIQAQAFTHGQDIYFGAGRYQPENDAGKQLLAHELTHTIQQTGSAQRAMLQRRFEAGTDFLRATAITTDFQAIANAMDAYNTFLDNSDKKPDDYGTAAGKLQLIERKIFAYMSANNATHEKLTDIPHYTALEALRVKAGEEHEEFVAAAAAGDHLPFDFTGMSFQQSIPLIRLWNQIKGGLGKIQLVGDPANKKRMLSWLVKLLETPTGRQLLGYLNEGDPSDALTNIYIGQTKDQLPEGVETGAKAKGKTLEDTGVSEAQPLGASGEILGPFDLKGDEKPRDYLTATSSLDFRTALLQNKKGVILNGKKYEFNKSVSVGAFVTAHEGASKNESATHHQIMTPGWLTMGHELGHAVHMRGGSTNMMDMANSPGKPGIMENITGENAEKLNASWQNGEEFMTINNWENSLRGDVGLTSRASHIPYTAGKKVERYYNIWPDVKATFRDSAYLETPTLKKFIKDLRAAFNSKDPTVNLENDVVYQTLNQRWLVLKTTNLDVEAIQFKKDQVKTKYEDMERKYQRKLPIYNKKWFPGKSKKAEWNHLVTERNTITDLYTNHLNAQIDLNVDPSTSLFGKFMKRIETAEEGFFKFSF